MLSGRTHQIITAVHLIWPLGNQTFCDVSHLTMDSITVKEIERYIDLERPFNCAGSYQIEKKGIGLFSQVDSRDFNAIVGLPLIALNHQIKKIQKVLHK